MLLMTPFTYTTQKYVVYIIIIIIIKRELLCSPSLYLFDQNNKNICENHSMPGNLD